MPQDLRVRVGVEVGTVVINGTAQQVADALRRYAVSLGIPTNGTATQNLEAILNSIIYEVKQRSKAVQTAELRAANEAAITATVDADNAL